MSGRTNRAVRLARRPQGLPADDVWRIEDAPVPEIGEGEVLVAVSHVSIDPAMRGWIEPTPSYLPPVEIGAVMRADAVGRIVASRAPGFARGDAVAGFMGVQRYWAGKPDSVALIPIDTRLAPPERYLGALGLSGFTAYFGIRDVGRIGEGDIVLISGAAGAVGGLAGQVARLSGAKRVVGIAGGPEKCAYVTDELGFDACIDYKAGNLFKALREACPKGIDLFFDNVGGEALEAALWLIRRNARVALCGAISAYNDLRTLAGPKSYFNLVPQRASMAGFIVLDYADRYAEARAALVEWHADGRLKAREHVEPGLDRFPDIFRMLFRGANHGKLVLAVDPD